MSQSKRALVFGGYGIFGSCVCRELARMGVEVTVAGRNVAKARVMAESLGPRHRFLQADVGGVETFQKCLHDYNVAVNCAGPFSKQGSDLLEACLAAGCHYADISDDRAYTQRICAFHERLMQGGICAVYGCSSLPGISCALAETLYHEDCIVPDHARITLFIGHRNSKGTAAVSSALHAAGKPIDAPQGTIIGFRGAVSVDLPEPFGRQTVCNFDSSDYDLLPSLYGLKSMTVGVGFELSAVTRTLSMLALLPARYRDIMSVILSTLARWMLQWGSSGGVIQVELIDTHGTIRRAALVAKQDGQRMAALPCALAVEALCSGIDFEPGTCNVVELLGGAPLLEAICQRGFEQISDTRMGT